MGHAFAIQLHEAGFLVYGVARRTDRMNDLAQRHQDHRHGRHRRRIDHDGSSQILTETGRIDVLVNNAGYGSYGAVEDVPLEEARRQFEVNVFGAARLGPARAPVDA